MKFIEDLDRVSDFNRFEKTAVLAYAEKHFASKNEIARDLLSEWLKCKPSKEMLEAWLHYVQGLCENLNPQEKIAFKDSIMDNAHNIAKASGGFLGIGNKISKEEEKILKILDEAFE
ncbi:MAG TPA: hypothetical protein VHP36_08475 [Chitinispirillaceae bacterium]|nr:hypothetical protein [Chitinispirillaceae bacterium]